MAETEELPKWHRMTVHACGGCPFLVDGNWCNLDQHYLDPGSGETPAWCSLRKRAVLVVLAGETEKLYR